MVEKKLLDRATYKKIKPMDKETMENFINNIYNTENDDAQVHAIDYDLLRADFAQIKGIGENRLNEIMAVIDKHISATNEE